MEKLKPLLKIRQSELLRDKKIWANNITGFQMLKRLLYIDSELFSHFHRNRAREKNIYTLDL